MIRFLLAPVDLAVTLIVEVPLVSNEIDLATGSPVPPRESA